MSVGFWVFFYPPPGPRPARREGGRTLKIGINNKGLIMKYHAIKKIARRLRTQSTPAEKTLWFYILNRKLRGRKFLRQHPIIYESNRNNHFCYIPDFYCREESLILELDGSIHAHQKEIYARRDLILQNKNLKVLRIKN